MAAFLVLALLVLVVGVGLLVLDGSGSDGDGTAAQEEGRSGSRSPGSTDSGGNGTSSGGDSSGASTGTEQVVEDYYAALPEDTRSGWSSLTPGFQDEVGDYGDYRGFWRTISSVEVTDTRSAGDDAVDVDLTYTRSDGSSEDETRRIYLEPSGDGYLIRGDDVR